MSVNGTRTGGTESSGMSEENSDKFQHNPAQLIMTAMIMRFFFSLYSSVFQACALDPLFLTFLFLFHPPTFLRRTRSFYILSQTAQVLLQANFGIPSIRKAIISLRHDSAYSDADRHVCVIWRQLHHQINVRDNLDFWLWQVCRQE